MKKQLTKFYHFNNYKPKPMKTLTCLKTFLAFFIFLGISSISFAQNNEITGPTDSIVPQTEDSESKSTPPVEKEESKLNSGNTAWMITATALVLFMTLPGLALFYGGLVQSKNVLSVLMHCFAVACLASIIWITVGYSLALTGGSEKSWIGGKDQFFLQNLTADSLNNDFPESVWITFQMTFAIITPALIVGAFVERIKFSAVLLFSALWLIVVYCPVCYWVWCYDADGNPLGWLAKKGVMDFAGGIVVHATAGASALTLAWMLGRRQGYPKSLKPPHSPGMVMTGAAMLWVGWFGFNAGSAAAANGSAGMAMLVTHISAATASLVWMFIEWKKTGKPGLVGIVTGMVAGLATITPASGSVGPMGAIVIGATAGLVCYFACGFVKEKLGIDDSLDVAAVHGVGGILGTLMLAYLGVEGRLGGQGLSEHSDGTDFTAFEQLTVQAQGCLAAVALSVVATFVIVKIVGAITGGIRVSEDDETKGLDQALHGENGYSLN
jgi:Amt family ammonium transporter